MSTNPRPNDPPLPPDANFTTTLSTSASPSLHDQYPSNPPPALTVVLSIVCGIVATCILFTVRINTSLHPLIQQLSPLKIKNKNTCILYQIVLLLLRNRSCKQAFRQGQQHPRRTFFPSKPKSGAEVHVPVGDDGSRGALDSEDREIMIYLPVLHRGSSSTQSKTKTSTSTNTRGSHRGRASGRISSLAYPNAVYLGTPRPDTMASFPSHVV